MIIDYQEASDDPTEEGEDEMIYDRPTPDIIRNPSTRLEEKYEVEESCLEGKKMEHEHPGTSAGASSTEVELQKENVAAIPMDLLHQMQKVSIMRRVSQALSIISRKVTTKGGALHL
ncbi:uncharacterized protein LOC130999777 [Salvia miltiorrhiza]|uniref:uncharacterized protein LOC130999777 n=1 Tax=Salvia miltiorrhiza TaxID=226208 RepID=UPI0025AC4B76|nr:uncharacterized protein LOC130999777 [Salvia miltiorrhiza]